jgi:hypothetical protein
MTTTTSPVRKIGCVMDIHGTPVTVGVDHDTVTITGNVALDAGGREHFSRLYFEAERQAEAWQAEHGEDEEVPNA